MTFPTNPSDVLWPSPQEFPVGAINTTKFQLVFPRLPHLEMFCNKIILPKISMNYAPQETPYLQLKHTGEKITYDNLPASFLMDAQMKNYKEVFYWMKRISTEGKHSDDSIDARLITHVGTFIYENVVPIVLGNVEFDATQSTIDFPTCQVVFAYDRFYPE